MTLTQECKIQFPTVITGTGINESQTFTIKPCDLCEDCYVKENKFWCNCCVTLYELIMPMIDLPPPTILGICMKALRGQISGERCQDVIEKLKRLPN